MISQEIHYVGVNDHAIDLFESQYRVPNGMAYNSYVITDEKNAVIDSVDAHFTEAWLDNIQNVLGGKAPDYIIIQHMEPDHSGSLLRFLEAYPAAKVVASAKTFPMIQNFFSAVSPERQVTVGEGDTLALGKHTLQFIAAPMVHWPEVIMTYDKCDKVLFSADGFGKFGALDADEDWDCEARRYYFNIVGKYGPQVQSVLKKAAGLDIQIICPLHGPVLKEGLGHYLNKYDIWSSYGVESEGVFIACASIHGNTAAAVDKLAEILRAKGCPKVAMADLTRDDMAEALEDAFRYGKVVLAAASYNAGVMPAMEDFLHHLKGKNYQNRTVALVENGSWAPTAARTMREVLGQMKNITVVEPTVTIRGALKDSDLPALEALADAIL